MCFSFAFSLVVGGIILSREVIKMVCEEIQRERELIHQKWHFTARQ